MEGKCTEVADRTESFLLVAAHHSLSGIFYNVEVVPGCNRHNGVHFTAYSCIMHHHNSPGSVVNGRLDQAFINVQGIRRNIYEYRFRAPDDKCIGCTYECIARHDYFVAGLYV